MVRTEESVQQVYFLSKFVNHNTALAYVGPTAVGKTLVTKNFMMQLPPQSHLVNHIHFCGKTTAAQTYSMIMSKLDRLICFHTSLRGPHTGSKQRALYRSICIPVCGPFYIKFVFSFLC